MVADGGAPAAAELASVRGEGRRSHSRCSSACGEARRHLQTRAGRLPPLRAPTPQQWAPGPASRPPAAGPHLFLHAPSDATGRLRLERALCPVNPLSKDLDHRPITALGSGDTVPGPPFTALPPWVHAADEIKAKPKLHAGGLPSRHPRRTSWGAALPRRAETMLSAQRVSPLPGMLGAVLRGSA